MSEKILYNKISKGLVDICGRQKINLVNKFYLIVNNDCEITPEDLHDHLKEEIPNYISPDITIIIERKNIEILSAIIYKVEGKK